MKGPESKPGRWARWTTALRTRARWAARVAVILVAAMAGILFQHSSFGTRFEQGLYDLRFRLRGPLPPDPKNAPITILAVDEETFDRLKKPLVFWQGEFGEVIQRVVDGGAAVVGLDFLFWDVSEWQPEGDSDSGGDLVLTEAILEDQRKLAGAIITSNLAEVRVVLGYQGDDRLGTQLPARLRLAAGDGGLGYVNLRTDSDDFVRRQDLYSPSADGGEVPSFAAAILEAYTGQPVDFTPTPEAPRSMLINYRGLEVFPEFSFWSAVRAARENDEAFFEAFKDRIVLVGEVAEEDRHPTPLYYWVDREKTRQKARTAGVLIHANTIATILERNFIRQPPDYQQSAIILAVAAVTALIGFRAGSLRVVTAAALTALFGLTFFGLFAALFSRGLYLYLAGPLAALFVAGGASMAANYMLEGREKRRLRNLFKRYVDDTVIERILAQPNLALAGERKSIAVLFSDIRNFTGRSETVPPEELVSRLNEYFTRMVRVILDNRGTVDKFIGDGIMAIFGAPLEDPDAPLNAVRAGQAMLKELDDLNESWSRDGFEPIRIGIGVHCGEAVVGNIGSPEKMEYTAIGDVVNTASRIEGLNKTLGTDLLISGDAYDAVAAEVTARRLPDEVVKGKSRAVRVYCVAAPESVPRPA